MKRYLPSRCFSSIVILMAFLTFSAPFVALAQQAEIAEARATAETDATSDTNSTLWLGVGCLGGLLGVGAAYLIEPSPPSSRLIGRSPEYVAAYTDAYKAKGKSIQTSKAWIGFLASVAAGVVIVVLAAAANADNNTNGDYIY